MRRNYKSLSLEEQDLIAVIDTYKTSHSLRLFFRRESQNISKEAGEYIAKKIKQLKRAEYEKYYKHSENKYLHHITTAKRKAKLESYLLLDLSDKERKLVLKKLKDIGDKPPEEQTVRMRHYKYLDIIDRCNNVTTLQTYRTFTDITKYELKVIAIKINKLNKEYFRKKLEESDIKKDINQQIEYEKTKDKMMKEFLAKGGTIKHYDFGL